MAYLHARSGPAGRLRERRAVCVGLPGRITATTDVVGFLVGAAVRILDESEAQETLALLRSVPQDPSRGGSLIRIGVTIQPGSPR